tara:strand:- start:194 stop:589 length:396 start_codon:yes stop_codon:yes gene_type:complete
MEDSFKIEIITPEKIIFSEEITMATLPSYEGDMSILKNHISIITFLRPGIIKINKKENNLGNFFVQDGTIEYFDNTLVVLSSSAISIKDISKDYLDNLSNDISKKLSDKNITDHDRYILNHKFETIKGIRV